VNEVLILDPDNVKALQRRAKATSLPVNSSVEDLNSAVKDLKKVQQLKGTPSKRIDNQIALITC
jgi:phosphoribosylanthranilate isomerase